ncbi:MAG TPA: CBS domain-containing protein [Gaiellaceae bacterium]|nr:CBS domain-containing protein [Gaiellaceae bacterium]
MLRTIADVLRDKGDDVWKVAPTAAVSEATKLMAEKRIGALLVLSADELVGVITLRDCVRNVSLAGRSVDEALVGECMSSPVVFVGPEHTVGDCLRIMTEKGIGHLPVVGDGRLIGVVSRGDLLRSLVKTQSATIGHLEGYITGTYPG